MIINIRIFESDKFSTLMGVYININKAIFTDVVNVSLDQIEDLELDLTNIVKQLQDYRIKHNHE